MATERPFLAAGALILASALCAFASGGCGGDSADDGSGEANPSGGESASGGASSGGASSGGASSGGATASGGESASGGMSSGGSDSDGSDSPVACAPDLSASLVACEGQSPVLPNYLATFSITGPFQVGDKVAFSGRSRAQHGMTWKAYGEETACDLSTTVLGSGTTPDYDYRCVEIELPSAQGAVRFELSDFGNPYPQMTGVCGGCP